MVSNLLKSCTVSVAAIAATAPGFADPVYLIAQIQIENHEGFFNEYGAAAGPVVLDSGGEVLVATPTVQNLEGEWDGNWTVVIEFPSEEAALEDWYNNDAYQGALKYRLDNTSKNNLVIAQAFVPPSQ